MKVLAVSTFRTEEVTRPMEHMDADVEVVEVDSSASLLARDFRVATGTLRALRRRTPDVVLLDCHESMGFIATLAVSLFGVPMVCRLVGDNWRTIGEEGLARARSSGLLATLAHRLSYRLNRFIYARAEGFVVVSTPLREVVAERTACPRDRIVVVPLPVRSEPPGSGEAARRTLGVEEERVVLTVTNLNFRAKLEGVKTILEELGEILETNGDLAYVIAGGGFYYDDLVEHVDASTDLDRDRVYTPGWVSSVGDLYELADLFVYVSFLDGYPNVVLEAQAAGLPVVANAAYGMVDQVQDGENGRLVDPSERGELGRAVSELLDDPERRVRYGESGRERVLRENDPAVIGQQLALGLSRILAEIE